MYHISWDCDFFVEPFSFNLINLCTKQEKKNNHPDDYLDLNKIWIHSGTKEVDEGSMKPTSSLISLTNQIGSIILGLPRY